MRSEMEKENVWPNHVDILWSAIILVKRETAGQGELDVRVIGQKYSVRIEAVYKNL